MGKQQPHPSRVEIMHSHLHLFPTATSASSKEQSGNGPPMTCRRPRACSESLVEQKDRSPSGLQKGKVREERKGGGRGKGDRQKAEGKRVTGNRNVLSGKK